MTDFDLLIDAFGSANPLIDLDGDGVVLGSDFSLLNFSFGSPPGPSGLACADATLETATSLNGGSDADCFASGP